MTPDCALPLGRSPSPNDICFRLSHTNLSVALVYARAVVVPAVAARIVYYRLGDVLYDFCTPLMYSFDSNHVSCRPRGMINGIYNNSAQTPIPSLFSPPTSGGGIAFAGFMGLRSSLGWSQTCAILVLFELTPSPCAGSYRYHLNPLVLVTCQTCERKSPIFTRATSHMHKSLATLVLFGVK